MAETELNDASSMPDTVRDLGEQYLQMGKQCLQRLETEEVDASAQTAIQAVDWLINASKEGNEEATNLLRDCVEKDIGMNEDNAFSVDWCLQTSSLERAGRAAAKQLFCKINPLRSATMNRNSFLNGIGNIETTRRERKLLEKAAKFRGDSELTENMFVDKLTKRLLGYASATIEPQSPAKTYEHASTFQKVTRYPLQTTRVVVDKAVEVASKRGSTWLRSLVPTQQISTVLLLCFYSLLSRALIFFVFPLVTFYAGLFTMIVTTLQMFYSRRKQNDVRLVAGLLRRFNSLVDGDTAESAYQWGSLTPYAGFFAALFVTVGGYSLVDPSWVANAELACVSGALSGAAFMALGDMHDRLMLGSFACHVISTLPSLCGEFCWVLSPFLSVQLVPFFFVNLSIPSLASLVVPALFVRMAARGTWRGTYRVLVPHVVCLAWWQLTATFFHGSTWASLVRASSLWAGFIFLFPLMLVGGVIYACVYLSKLVSVANLLKLFTTAVLISLPFAVTLWMRAGPHLQSMGLTSGRKKLILLGIFAFGALAPLFIPAAPLDSHPVNYLDWPRYQRHCAPGNNMAVTQISCARLTDTVVRANGTVQAISVIHTDNQVNKLVGYLPSVLADWIRCTYGVVQHACAELPDEVSRDRCEMSTLQRQCHLRNWNRYTFGVSVKMAGDTANQLTLEATHGFREILLNIEPGMTIQFHAALDHNMGTANPILTLYDIECHDTERPLVKHTSGIPDDSWRFLLRMRKAVFDVWNFFCAPLVEFRPPDIADQADD